MKNPTVKQIIEKNREKVLACKDARALSDLIAELGCKTQHRWGKAVAAVIEIGGIDYYAARGEQRAATAEDLRQTVTHELTLFVDAKARCQRFAICDQAGEPVWFGIFFENDNNFYYGDRNEQSACECAAARKAIWLASRVKESVGAPALRLALKVDAQWLCSLAGKATILATDARRFNIELVMEWIPGTENPADQFTTARGYKKWSDNDLAALAVSVRELTAEDAAKVEQQRAFAAAKKEAAELRRREENEALAVASQQAAYRNWIQTEARKNGDLPPTMEPAVFDDVDGYDFFSDDY